MFKVRFDWYINKCLGRAAFGWLNGSLWLCWSSTSVFLTSSVRVNCREESDKPSLNRTARGWRRRGLNGTFVRLKFLVVHLTIPAVRLTDRDCRWTVYPRYNISRKNQAANYLKSLRYPRPHDKQWTVLPPCDRETKWRNGSRSCDHVLQLRLSPWPLHGILIRKKIKIPTRNQKIKYVINIKNIERIYKIKRTK